MGRSSERTLLYLGGCNIQCHPVSVSFMDLCLDVKPVGLGGQIKLKLTKCRLSKRTKNEEAKSKFKLFYENIDIRTHHFGTSNWLQILNVIMLSFITGHTDVSQRITVSFTKIASRIRKKSVGRLGFCPVVVEPLHWLTALESVQRKGCEMRESSGRIRYRPHIS